MSIFLESRDLHQFIDIIRCDLRLLKVVLIWAGSWVSFSRRQIFPNVLVSYSKSIKTTIKISIVLKRRHLHQLKEVIRWDFGPLKVVLITARSWETWSKWAFCDRAFQIQARIKNTSHHFRTLLMTSMNCWRSVLSKNMLVFIVASILFELQTKTFG